MLQRKYPLHRVIIVSRSDVSFYIGAHRCKLPIVSIWYNLKRENLRQRLSTLACTVKNSLDSRGVVSQRRNERGIEHQVAFSPFPLFHSYVNRGQREKKKKGIGVNFNHESIRAVRWNFRNIGRNIPIPRIIASLSCKPTLRSRFGDRLYARFCIRKACRATWHLPRAHVVEIFSIPALFLIVLLWNYE